MQEKTIDLKGFAISGALFETTSRYGSAGSEFLKGLRGIDYQTGQEFDKLTKIIKHAKRNFWLNDICTCHGLLPSHSA